MAIGPRAQAQEPFSGAQWRGTNRLAEMGNGIKKNIPQSKGQDFRFKSCLCCLLAMTGGGGGGGGTN